MRIKENKKLNQKAIAMLTPYIGGDAVYMARVMLGINPNDYNLAYRYGRPTDTTGILADENNAKVYPNPASNSLNIEFEYTLEQAGTFVLYDITGRKIKEYKLSVGLDKFSLDISALKNGVYFYSLSSDIDVRGKVIINTKYMTKNHNIF